MDVVGQHSNGDRWRPWRRWSWWPGSGAGGAAAVTPSGMEIGYDYPRWQYPEYPAGSVVEIRVHGVGGEPPSRMARDPHPVLVGGDEVAGFWRARDPVVASLADRPSDGTTTSNGDGPGRRADEPAHVREVLSWGGETRGTWRHALWVLLLPFSLVNLAGRMQPYDVTGLRARWYRRVVRLLGYTLTLTATALAAGVAFDLLGAQCAQTAACLEGGAREDGPRLLQPLRALDGHPAAQMGLLAVLPVAVVLVLWLAGRYRTRQLEGYQAEGHVPGDEVAEPVRLHETDFWHNEWPTSRLRAAHASGAFAYLGLVLSSVLLDLGGGEGWWLGVGVSSLAVVGCGAVVAASTTVAPRQVQPLTWALTGLRLAALAPLTIGAVAGLVTATDVDLAQPVAIALAVAGIAAIARWVRDEVRPRRRTAGIDASADGGRRHRPRPDVRLIGNLLLGGGLAAVTVAVSSRVGTLDVTAPVIRDWADGAGALAWSALLPGDLLPWFAGLYLPAYAPLVALMLLQGGLLLLIAALAFDPTKGATRRDAGPLRGPGVWGNLGGAVCALLALLLVAAAGAGAHAAILAMIGSRASADDVARAVSAAEGASARLVLPWWYADTAVAVLAVIVAAVGAGLTVWVMARRGPASNDLVAADLDRGWEDPENGRKDADERVQERLGAIALKWHTVHLVRLAGNAALAAVGLGTLAAAALVLRRALGPNLDSGLPAVTADPWLAGVALPITTAGAIALFEFLRRGMKNPGDSVVAGVWDVVNFWPRVTHPFAPPCYGEAVVPMLRARIHGLLHRPGTSYRVLLAGHSQGSVVSLAAVLTLPQPQRDRVALVSYGSPIAVLYERHFRGVIGTDEGAISKACETVSSWHHFFALTEPFAAPFWWARAEDGETRKALDRRHQGCGWRVNTEYQHADVPCLACGWSRADPMPAPTWEQRCTTVDVVVTDPQRWRMPLDTVLPAIAGHGTYHDSLEMDDHLHVIAWQLTGCVPQRLGHIGRLAERARRAVEAG